MWEMGRSTVPGPVEVAGLALASGWRPGQNPIKSF